VPLEVLVDRTAYAIPERIDRMPMTREYWWVLPLSGVAWLIESYDIGIVGDVLPFLQRQFALDAFMVGSG
jgi:MFS transporter, putative metabolite:H+ symporter